MEFRKACAVLSRNHRISTPHRSETYGIAERAVREKMKRGGLILWNAIVICEMSKTSWQTGKHRTKKRFGEPFKRANNTFWSKGWISSPKDQMRIHQFGKKVPPGIFPGYELSAGGYSDSWLGRFGNGGRIGYLPSKNQSKGSIDQPERWRIRYPIRRWNSKIVIKNIRIPSTHSEAGTTCKEWKSVEKIQDESEESQPAEPTDDAEARADFGRFRVTSFVVITLNLEFNSMCLKKKR